METMLYSACGGRLSGYCADKNASKYAAPRPVKLPARSSRLCEKSHSSPASVPSCKNASSCKPRSSVRAFSARRRFPWSQKNTSASCEI